MAGSELTVGIKRSRESLIPDPVSDIRVNRPRACWLTRELFSTESLPEILNSHEQSALIL